MKILFVFTGGTIGSTAGEHYISPDPRKSYGLLSEYAQRYPVDFAYDVLEPYTELSENNTGETLGELLRAVAPHLTAYDGIVITHGTDTLQYSSAALGYLTGSDSIPVCLVSANYPIEDHRSNGIANLRAAICFIAQQAGRGAFTVYRNVGDPAPKVYRATRLLAGAAFTDRLDAAMDQPYGFFDEDFRFVNNPWYGEETDALLLPPCLDLKADCTHILRLAPHPGMRYPALDDDVRYVLLDSYHSGTVNTKSETARTFFKLAASKGISVFLTGATGERTYESTRAYAELGITPLVRIAPIAAYLKLWLYADSKIDAHTVLHLSRGGDVIPFIDR